jgi:AcrR family transcriptional regulator
VLSAAADALAENGYDSFTVEDVAERAGVHKTTVYRRWPTKAELIADTTRERSRQLVPMPDTGSLAGDLRALARAVVRNIGSDTGGRMTRTLVAAAATSPDNAAQSAAFWAERLDLTNAIFERAMKRGEIPADTDGQLIIQTLIGPLYVRLLLTNQPIDIDFADRVAAFVYSAVEMAHPRTAAGKRIKK